MQAGGQEFESLRLHLQRTICNAEAEAKAAGTLKTEYRKDLKRKTSKAKRCCGEQQGGAKRRKTENQENREACNAMHAEDR